MDIAPIVSTIGKSQKSISRHKLQVIRISV